MANPEFDVVIIGGGPGGYVGAIRAAQHGLKVACVEKRAALGGTCLNVGCIPSKALLNGSHLYEELAGGHLAKFGVKADNVSFDLSALLGEKDKAVSELTGGIAMLFKKNKVEWIKGEASFIDAKSVKVGDRTITAKNFVIATGSEVALLPGMTPDGEVIVTSTEALNLPKVPEHLVVIGGGYIGLEMGSVWRRLGAKVTVVEYAPRIVPAMDIEVANAFAKILTKQGLVLKTATKVVSVERTGAGATVTVEPAAGGPAETITADVCLVAIGVLPVLPGGPPPKLSDRGYIEVDDRYQTSIPGVYAAGDITGPPWLAHTASFEAVQCIEGLYLEGHTPRKVKNFPGCIYCHPQVASVGKTERALKEAGIAYTVGKIPFAAIGKAIASGEPDGFAKLLYGKEHGELLGAHIIGENATELIAEMGLALDQELTAEDIHATIHAHPTMSEVIHEATLAAEGHAIHF